MVEVQRKTETIFWIEVSSIKPNSKQPRTEFDETKLRELASSIKQYGILQPLLVSRLEQDIETGTIVEYEIISGERRWRAAQIAGLNQVPVIIRKEPPEKVKLELALIENIQRTNLNPIERGRAFKQLAEEFDMKHHEIGWKIGKSRGYVTNTMRLLNLPQEMLDAVAGGKITELHGRSLLSLSENPDAQKMLFNDIINKSIPSKEAEKISRRLAYHRARKQKGLPFYEEMRDLENRFANLLGTRVLIDRKGDSGQISIAFSSENQLKTLLGLISVGKEKSIFEDFKKEDAEINNTDINAAPENSQVEFTSNNDFNVISSNPYDIGNSLEEADENISVFEINSDDSNLENDLTETSIAPSEIENNAPIPQQKINPQEQKDKYGDLGLFTI